jgi:hypothetical protein
MEILSNKMNSYTTEEEKENNKLNIVMSRELKEKLDYLNTNYPKEVAGYITGKFDRNQIYLKDLLVPEQEVGYSCVDIFGKSTPKVRKEYGDKCKEIICKWHSHHNMGAFWSGSGGDEDDITQWMGPRDAFLFMVSGKGNHRIRLEMRKPFFLSLDNLPYEVEWNEKIVAEMEKVIKTKLKEPEYKGVSGATSFSGYGASKVVDKEEIRRFTQGGLNEYTDITEENIENCMGKKECLSFYYDGSEKKLKVGGIWFYYLEVLLDEFEGLIKEIPTTEDSTFFNLKIDIKDRRDIKPLIKKIKMIAESYGGL